jgi:hypothetical protein
MGVQRFGDLSLRLAAVDEQAFIQSVQSLIFRNKVEAASTIITKRSLIQWEAPHIGGNQTIEMYINPQNIQFSSRKEINRVRTKGGYSAQYWGEDLDTITMTGTTGSSAIEGINVLRDVYRSEQLTLAQIVQQNPEDKRRQSLMQLAASVVMWYQGQGYRGYFTDMTFMEGVDKLGTLDYTMTFMVVEFLGQRRRNFLPWHRHPWSTTETPNLDPTHNQSISGGGYAEGKKVGILNAPLFYLASRNILNVRGETVGAVEVAVLRPDTKDKDPTGAIAFDNQILQDIEVVGGGFQQR